MTLSILRSRGADEVRQPVLSEYTKAADPVLEHENDLELWSLSFDHNRADVDEDKPRPTRSLQIEELEDDDDNSTSPPPRLSVLSEAYADTELSIEAPRQAFDEQLVGRLSKGSIADLHMNDTLSGVNQLDDAPFSDSQMDTITGLDQTKLGFEQQVREVIDLRYDFNDLDVYQ